MPKTRPFPIELLKVKSGSFCFTHGYWKLILGLEKFDLPNGYDGSYADMFRDIETKFEIDFVKQSPVQMAGQTVRFELPNNELDGSIYLEHAHHPVDIFELDARSLRFPPSEPCTLQLKFEIVLSHEGLAYAEHHEYGDCRLAYKLQLTPEDGGWIIGPADPIPLADS